MTHDNRQRRDARIAALEALGPRRTLAERDELRLLERRRDGQWRRLADSILRARRELDELEAYARQHRIPFEGASA